MENRNRRFRKDANVLENVSAIADFFTRTSGRRGLCLMGLYGNGKTSLLRAMQDMINNYLVKCRVLRAEQGLRIVGAKEIAQWEKEGNVAKMDGVYRCGHLCIDELGGDPDKVVRYGNVSDPIIDLLEYRYDEQMFTIVSTNLQLDDIKNRYGGRIYDRFIEMFDVVLFKNKSYR